MNTKKLLITIVLLVNVTVAFSQEFFVREYDVFEKTNIKFDEALTAYEYSRTDFMNLFSNDLLMILLGDKDRLNKPLDIFSLAQVEKPHIRLLRNMIYARYGLRFNASDLNTYFNRFKWYNPTSNNVDAQLTEGDKYKIQLLQTFENRNENLPNVQWDKNKVGVWQSSFGMAAGWGDRFVIHPTHQLEYHFSQMRELPIVYCLKGAYIIKGNVLTWSVNEIEYSMTGLELSWSGAFGYEFSNAQKNTIRLEKPVIYKFPVSTITKKKIGDKDFETEVTIITIGGHDFYKMSDGVNPY